MVLPLIIVPRNPGAATIAEGRDFFESKRERFSDAKDSDYFSAALCVSSII
jgi:hypothetical protein